MSTSSSLVHETFRRGLQGFRQNAPGMAIIIALGLAILGGYSALPLVRESLDRLAAWKIEAGWIYPVCSMALVAGVVPTVLRVLMTGTRPPRRCWAVIGIYWPFRGIEIDLLYRGLGALVGNDPSVTTVLTKVVLDMALYVPFWALPLYLLVSAWQHGEDPVRLLRDAAFWRERYLPGVMANWLLWVPAVAIIYALPPGLQLPVQNLFMIIWVFIVEVIARSKDPAPARH